MPGGRWNMVVQPWISLSFLCSATAGVIMVALAVWPPIVAPTSRRHKLAFLVLAVLGVGAVISSEWLHHLSDDGTTRQLSEIARNVRKILQARGLNASGDLETLLDRLRRALPRKVSPAAHDQLVAALRAVGPHTVSISVEENATDGGDLAVQLDAIFHEAGWQVERPRGTIQPGLDPGLFYRWDYPEPAPVEFGPFLIAMDAAGIPLHEGPLVAPGQNADGKLLILIERNPNSL